jgi:hypothetical protein
MSGSRSLWRYFLDIEKTFRFFVEGNGVDVDPLSEVRKRLQSYLEQYIINEAGVIKSERTTVFYPHKNINEPNY